MSVTTAWTPRLQPAGITVGTEIDLLVVGAGAKATALAAKVHALNTLGAGPFALTIVEATEVAASWLGRNGMTSGEEPLAIPPIKDIGFPYQSSNTFGELGAELDRAMMPFTWQQYMIGKGHYARWVNAGSPAVQHRDYGRYLTWVLAQTTAGVRIVRGRVTQVSLPERGERWNVEVRRLRQARGMRATRWCSPAGRPSRPPPRPRRDGADLPLRQPPRRAGAHPAERGFDIAIVGGGESALSAVAFLRDFRPAARMTVYTPTLPLSRGESFLENRVFSNPDEVAWSALDPQTRRDFVKHCDRGVFDPGRWRHRLRRPLPLCHRPRAPRRRARGGQRRGRWRVRAVRRSGGRCGPQTRLPGQLHWLRPAGATARPLLPRAARGDRAPGGAGVGAPPGAEVAIGRALELEGMRPRLHIPGLGALSQGPGFANLGCLGLLANRVLAPLVAASDSGCALTRGGELGDQLARLGAGLHRADQD